MNIVQDKNMLPDDQWIDVCALDDLTPNTGAGALVGGKRLQSSVWGMKTCLCTEQ